MPSHSRSTIRPRLAEPVAVVGAHLRPIGHPTVELGLDERCDVHAVDDDVLQLPVDPHVEQLDSSHPGLGEERGADVRSREVHVPQACVGEVDVVEGGPSQAHAPEPCTGEVLLDELGHDRTLGPVPDDLLPLRPVTV